MVHGTVSCLIDVNIMTRKWIFTLKYYLDSSIAHHKAQLVARGCTKAYRTYYIGLSWGYLHELYSSYFFYEIQ